MQSDESCTVFQTPCIKTTVVKQPISRESKDVTLTVLIWCHKNVQQGVFIVLFAVKLAMIVVIIAIIIIVYHHVCHHFKHHHHHRHHHYQSQVRLHGEVKCFLATRVNDHHIASCHVVWLAVPCTGLRDAFWTIRYVVKRLAEMFVLCLSIQFNQHIYEIVIA